MAPTKNTSIQALEMRNPIDESLVGGLSGDIQKHITELFSQGEIKFNTIKDTVIDTVVVRLGNAYGITDQKLIHEIATKSLNEKNIENEIHQIIDNQVIDIHTSFRLAKNIIQTLNQHDKIYSITHRNVLQNLTNRVNSNIQEHIATAKIQKGHNSHLGGVVNGLEIAGTMSLTTNGLANILQSTTQGIASSFGIGAVNAIINTHLGRSIMHGMEKSESSSLFGKLKDSLSPTVGALGLATIITTGYTGYIDREASIGSVGITAAANAEVNNRLTKSGGMNESIDAAKIHLPNQASIQVLDTNLKQFILDEESSGKSSAYNFKYRVINGVFSPLAKSTTQYNINERTVESKLNREVYPQFVNSLTTIAINSKLDQATQAFIKDPQKSYTQKLAYLQNLATEVHTNLKNTAENLTIHTSIKDGSGNFKAIDKNYLFPNHVGLAFTSPGQAEEALKNIANTFEETQAITTQIKLTTDQLATVYDQTLRSIHDTAKDNYPHVTYHSAPNLSYQVQVPDYSKAVQLAQKQVKIDLDNDASLRIIKESFGEENFQKINQFCTVRGVGIAGFLAILSLAGIMGSIFRQRKNNETTNNGLKAYTKLIETIIDSVHMHLNDDIGSILTSNKDENENIPRSHVSHAVWSWIVSNNPNMQEYAPVAYIPKDTKDKRVFHKIQTFIWQGLSGDTRTDKQIQLNELIKTFKEVNITSSGKIDGEHLNEILIQLGVNIDKGTSRSAIKELAKSLTEKQDILDKQFKHAMELYPSMAEKMKESQENMLAKDSGAHSPEHQSKQLYTELSLYMGIFESNFLKNIEQTLSDEGISSKTRLFRDEMRTYVNRKEEEIEKNITRVPTVNNLPVEENGGLRKVFRSLGNYFGSLFSKKTSGIKEDTIKNEESEEKEKILLPTLPVIHSSHENAYSAFQGGHETLSQMIHHLPATKGDIIKIIENKKHNKSLSDNVWGLVEDIRKLDTLHSEAERAIQECSEAMQGEYMGDKKDVLGYFDFIVQKKLIHIISAQKALKEYRKEKSKLENLEKDSTKKYIFDALKKVNGALSQERQREIMAIDEEYKETDELSYLSEDEFNELKINIQKGKVEREKREQNTLFLQSLVERDLISTEEQKGLFDKFLDKNNDERETITKMLEIRKSRKDQIQQEGLELYMPKRQIMEKEDVFEGLIKEARKQKYKKEMIYTPLHDSLVNDGIILEKEDHDLMITAETDEDAARVKHLIKVRHAKMIAINQLINEGFSGKITVEDITDPKVMLDSFYRNYIHTELTKIGISWEFDGTIENKNQADEILLKTLSKTLKNEAPSFYRNGSIDTPESIIITILQQRNISANRILLNELDKIVSEKGISGKSAGPALKIREDFARRANSGEVLLTKEDLGKTMEEMLQKFEMRTEEYGGRSKKVNDGLGDSRNILDTEIRDSLLSLKITDEDVESQLQRIQNLHLLIGDSQIKIQKWMLHANDEQYHNLCTILEQVAGHLNNKDVIGHKITLESATKFGKVALDRYMSLIRKNESTVLQNENILSIIQNLDDTEYILKIDEIS